MTRASTNISDWITESTRYVIHLNTAILYKETPTVEVPLVEITEVSDKHVVGKTPVDVGDDTSPVEPRAGERSYPSESVSRITFLQET